MHGEDAKENCNRPCVARSCERQAASHFSAGSIQMPHHRRTGARHGRHRVHWPPDRRRRGRAGSHGARQRLFRSNDAFRRSYRWQDGINFLRFDRVRRRQSHRLDRGSDGARPGGGHGALSFPLRSGKNGRRRAFRCRLQPRIRFAGAGGQSRSRRRSDGFDSGQVGCQRSGVQLEDSSTYRRISRETFQGPRNSEVCLRAQRAGIRSGVHRFGIGNRLCLA